VPRSTGLNTRAFGNLAGDKLLLELEMTKASIWHVGTSALGLRKLVDVGEETDRLTFKEKLNVHGSSSTLSIRRHEQIEYDTARAESTTTAVD
jgi:hypothetical protein